MMQNKNVSLLGFGKSCKSLLVALSISTILLSGCQSTSHTAPSVGPTMGGPSQTSKPGTANRKFNYTSNIYLDVAIPVFDPGIPMDSRGNIDDKEVAEKDIWPQVRRLEANRFAVDTKRALSATKSFGSVNVTPNAYASADVYVFGKIIRSDTETVEINVIVKDATDATWGSKKFEHRVSEAFYRDALRKEQNSYDPIFNDIAVYVYELLSKQTEKQKTAIKQVSDLRYATMYSPEAFSPYVKTKRKSAFSKSSVFSLAGAPSQQDPMLKRVSLLQAKDEQFIDKLQDNYEAFYLETDEAYRAYQRETLPVAKKIRENIAKRNTKVLITVLTAAAGVALDKNSNSDLGQLAKYAMIGATAYSISEVFKDNKELAADRDIISEMSQGLDLKITPQVVELNDQTIELQGTASEQFAQYRQRLLDIYNLEATPMVQL